MSIYIHHCLKATLALALKIIDTIVSMEHYQQSSRSPASIKFHSKPFCITRIWQSDWCWQDSVVELKNWAVVILYKIVFFCVCMRVKDNRFGSETSVCVCACVCGVSVSVCVRVC